MTLVILQIDQAGFGLTAVVLEWSRIFLLLKGRESPLKAIGCGGHMVHLISCHIVITAGLRAEVLKFSPPTPAKVQLHGQFTDRRLRMNGTEIASEIFLSL